MSYWEQVEEDDYEDIRIAVVMNGGVSLAIWIGGVARELNRLTSVKTGDATCYGKLLDIVKGTARVDVLSGTSAGGINAGFLALAAAYGSDLTPLGGLWADKGGLLDLMRSPMDKQTPSLLRGDAYFLNELRRAFKELVPSNREAHYRRPDEVPLDLTITTTILNGRIEQFEDDFGTPIPQREHRGRFHFFRDDRVSVENDPFAGERIWAQLALAARSTASFPFAFEPSFVPVDLGTREPDAAHPRIEPSIANFSKSRYVVDGGVLLNMPVKPALEAILSQKADRQVRRVLAYINPDPGVVVEGDPDVFAQQPSVADVMTAALVRLPAAQSIAQDLEDLRDHNRRVRDQRRLRPNLLADLGATVEGLADRLFDAYRKVRIARAASRVADIVQAEGKAGVPPLWVREEILAAFEAPEPPVPKLPFIPERLALNLERWDWGLAPVERLAIVAHDLLKRGIFACPLDDKETRKALRESRAGLHDLSESIEALRRGDTEFWQSAASNLPDPPQVSSERKDKLRNWAIRQAEIWTDQLSAPIGEGTYTAAEMELLAYQIVQVLVDALPHLRAAAQRTDPGTDPLMRDARLELNRILDTMFGDSTAPDHAAYLQRMLRVEVCFMALGGAATTLEQDVRLLQLSGNTRHHFTGEIEADDKLAGVQLAHFGAFYKKSWRVNDWTWGRMDGALRLTEAILDPARLRQLGLRVEDALTLVRAAAVGGRAEAELAAAFDGNERTPGLAARLRDELSFLDDLELPLPPGLPVTASVIARRLYVEILDDELQAIKDAVDFDVEVDNALPRGNGPNFARTFVRVSKRFGGNIPPEEQLRLLRDARIGEERLKEEVGTDLFAATVSRAAAVTTSVVDAPKPKLGPLRSILRALRAVTLLLYSLVYGAVVGSRFGAAAVNFILAAGGALLAIALLSDEPPLVTMLAALIVVAGFMLAALRSRLWMFLLVLLLPFAGALVYIWLSGGAWEAIWERRVAIVTVLVLVIALSLLGSVRSPGRRRVR